MDPVLQEARTRGRGPSGKLRDAASLVALVLVLLAARSSLADHYVVPTGSMEPTIQVGDRILVNKAAYGLRVPFTAVRLFSYAAPARNDVVVLASPEDGTVLLKRVVAVPGDRVAVRAGRLWLNEHPVPVTRGIDGLREQLGAGSHAVRLDAGGGPDFGPVHMPDDHYLVLGDNRGNSKDGRFFGLVEGRAIRGRAAAVYYRGGLTWREL